ncbi:Crp/Fnr family transcriptional regulator [Kitasatospora sp. NRRL B-11411]|uniref:Crp/Fnr family transcriptional regulator n=1 Tax=Kitasatospora sp. NRRL B-11411 TaxID=1463822 RepID=UPI0004C2B5D7|nr:Crp/Fnr family transcriptional regulator [Kitasatospora sp. NRRL B-11411]
MDRHVPFLDALTPDARTALVELGGKLRTFHAGEVLIEEGDDKQELWFLHQGEVKVTCQPDGRTARLMDIKGPGDVVGEVAVMDSGPRSATVTASTEVTATVVPWQDLQPFFRNHPDALYALYQVLGDRLRRSDRRRMEFGVYSVPVRLARLLVELAFSYGKAGLNAVRIDVNLSQPEYAALIGSRTDAVHKALTTLRRAELITTNERRTHILNLAELRKAARLSVSVGRRRRHPPV